MKRFIPILLLGFSAPVTLACGSVSDPHCMEPVLHDPNSPHYIGGNGGGGYSAPSPRKVITIRIPDSWGAISLNNKTHIMDNMIEQPSERAAKKKVLESCRQRSPDDAKDACTTIFTFRNGWATVAEGKTPKGWYTVPATGPTKEAAEANAVAECTKDGAKDCKIIVPTFASLPK
ncbi:MAG: DUF4189 domain-containing protein [Neisseria sp.]|uniref:DUF4189 domain-containing protein n=1 Tax=Neisseria sp. TaxID=192066 RepID=UPI0026DD2054|nr:DUF4189 domain-containing protein [Neisseria sp.]MDO4640692.1 DUF4189 domain-containing protein [Neisseria sp.]